MNFKDEAVYYITRLLKKGELRSKRNNAKSGPFGKYQCIYIHIPKTAGISVSVSLLGKHIGRTSALRYQVLFGKEDFNRYFKFAFVRNPFTRLISAYEFLYGGGYSEKDKPIESIIKQYNGFDDFVVRFLTPETAQSNYYFKPQYQILCDSSDRIMIDFIGRFETLEKDYDYIREKIGVGEPLQKLNVTKKKRLSLAEYYSSDTVIQKVVSIYEKDFELFDYSKQLPAGL